MLLKTMLDIHNSQVEKRKQIHLRQVTITAPNNSLYRYTNYENTLEAIRDNVHGGVVLCYTILCKPGLNLTLTKLFRTTSRAGGFL